jgi:hypothetical protein
MHDDAAEIRAAGVDRRWEQEIQHEMMHRDRDRAGEDRTSVAINHEAGEGREEIHMHVDLPGMARHREHRQRHQRNVVRVLRPGEHHVAVVMAVDLQQRERPPHHLEPFQRVEPVPGPVGELAGEIEEHLDGADTAIGGWRWRRAHGRPASLPELTLPATDPQTHLTAVAKAGPHTPAGLDSSGTTSSGRPQTQPPPDGLFARSDRVEPSNHVFLVIHPPFVVLVVVGLVAVRSGPSAVGARWPAAAARQRRASGAPGRSRSRPVPPTHRPRHQLPGP